MIPLLVLDTAEWEWIVKNATSDCWLFDCPQPLLEKLVRTGCGRQKARQPGQFGVMLFDPLYRAVCCHRLSQTVGSPLVWLKS